MGGTESRVLMLGIKGSGKNSLKSALDAKGKIPLEVVDGNLISSLTSFEKGRAVLQERAETGYTAVIVTIDGTARGEREQTLGRTLLREVSAMPGFRNSYFLVAGTKCDCSEDTPRPMKFLRLQPTAVGNDYGLCSVNAVVFKDEKGREIDRKKMKVYTNGNNRETACSVLDDSKRDWIDHQMQPLIFELHEPCVVSSYYIVTNTETTANDMSAWHLDGSTNSVDWVLLSSVIVSEPLEPRKASTSEYPATGALEASSILSKYKVHQYLDGHRWCFLTTSTATEHGIESVLRWATICQQ